MTSFVQELKRLSVASRRDQPTPADFELTLRRFNLAISSLKPHTKHPITRGDLLAEFFNPLDPDQEPFASLPMLGGELSGQPEKDAKQYIPKSFPDFPSTHTYKYTPEADRDSRDPKRMREEAAKSAQQGEDALRAFLDTSKSQQQKKARNLAERDKIRKERHGLWETAMQQLLQSKDRGWDTDQADITRQSMIVNAEMAYERREVPRTAKKISGANESILSKG
jgi:transcription initiation factor TFIID subunit 8